MRIKQSNKTGKYSISGLPEDVLIEIHNTTTNKRLKADIQDALFNLVYEVNRDVNQNLAPGKYWRARGLRLSRRIH